jgi:hypothetical protein
MEMGRTLPKKRQAVWQSDIEKDLTACIVKTIETINSVKTGMSRNRNVM